jgi:hypothetical protein
MEFWTDEDTGIEYISCGALCVGDYGGAGSVGEANIRSLEAECDEAVIRHGYYSFRQLWLPATPHWQEVVEKLEENYPLYDDESHSEVESEWEEEAWRDFGRKDLLRGLAKAMGDELEEIAEGDLSEDDLWECYRGAMEETNNYPAYENSGTCLPIGRIQEAFNRLIVAKLEELA